MQIDILKRYSRNFYEQYARKRINKLQTTNARKQGF